MRLRARHRSISAAPRARRFYLNGAPIPSLTATLVLAPGANTITSDPGATGMLSGQIVNGSMASIPAMTGATGTATTGGSVTLSASSEFSGVFAAWKAADADTVATEFATAGAGDIWWIQALYANAIVPTALILRGRNSTEYPNAGVIEGSNDGTTWTQLATVGPLPGASGNQTISLANTAAYTRVRYRSTQKNPGAVANNIGLSTFQVAAAAASSLTVSIDVGASLTLSGASTFSGGATLSRGTVKATSSGALGTGAAVVTGGTLDLMALGYGALTAGAATVSGSGTLKRAAQLAEIATAAVWADAKNPGHYNAGAATWGAGEAFTAVSGVYDTAGKQVTFTTAQKAMGAAAIPANAGWWLAAVAGMTGGANARIFDSNYPSGGNNLVGWWGGNANAIYLDPNAPAGHMTGIAPDTALHLLLATRAAGGALAQYFDDRAVRTWAASSGSAKTWHINSGEPSACRVREVAIGRGDLTAAQVTQIYGYLAWANGMQANLPAAHAYKAAPPIATITQSATTVA